MYQFRKASLFIVCLNTFLYRNLNYKSFKLSIGSNVEFLVKKENLIKNVFQEKFFVKKNNPEMRLFSDYS